jgi:hypothetical protein
MDLTFLDTLKLEDGSGFWNFIRMAPTDSECLLKMIGGKISKENTRFFVVHMVKAWSVLTHWLLRCPRTRPHLKRYTALCQWIPLRTGLKEHVSELGLSSFDSLLQCCGAVRNQPLFSPSTMNRACVLGIRFCLLSSFLSGYHPWLKCAVRSASCGKTFIQRSVMRVVDIVVNVLKPSGNYTYRVL